MIVRAPLRRFTVDEYHRLAEAGILPAPETGVVLVDGRVIDKHPLRPHKYTTGDYYRMAEAGVLTEDDRVELIEGDIVEMAPIGSRHFAAVNRLTRALVTSVGARGIVSVQNPLLVNDQSVPQPDVVVLAARSDHYQSRLPGPESVLLLIEVSDSTLEFDTETKVPLYARAGIPEVWVVNLVHNSIEQFSGPGDDSYEDHRTHGRGSSLSPLALPGVVIEVDEVVGD